jgi:hypothetical protein
MHGMHALAVTLALLAPAAAAFGPAPVEAPDPLPLTLADAGPDGPLVVGVPAELTVEVGSTGLAGSGLQPPVERTVRLAASGGGGEAVAVTPDPVRLPPGAASAQARLGFTPARVGPSRLHVHAAWDTLPGEADLDVARDVVKDSLQVDAFAAGTVDADLDVPLGATLRSGHLAAEPLGWRVLAEHVPVNGTEPLRWVAAEGSAQASPGGAPWSAEARARYGPGLYTFRVDAGGERLAEAAAELQVAVPDVRADNATANFTIDVEDRPTTLRLASDSVNADGKAKTPGNAVITRVELQDPNGLGDVQRVTFAYFRVDAGQRVPVAARVLEQPGAALAPGTTQVQLEDRFELAPVKDADYVCRIVAQGTGAPDVERTFVITDVRPEASLAWHTTSFWPARAGTVNGTLLVRDANFGTGPLDDTDITELDVLHLLLYKGSVRVAEPGWSVEAASHDGPAPLDLDLQGQGTRSTPYPYEVVAGKGQLALPVAVHVPEGATPGSYRLSVQANSTLASAGFDVQALPRVTRLAWAGSALPGQPVGFQVEAAPLQGLDALELRAPWGARLRAPLAELDTATGTARWNGTLDVPLPLDDDAAWSLTALADLGDGRTVVDPLGLPVNARSASLSVGNVPPRVEASLEVGGVAVGQEAWLHPHAALELRARARVLDDNAMQHDLADEVRPLTAEVRDWRGGPAMFEVDGDFQPAGTELAVQPLGVEPGRYTLTLRARDDDNASGEQRLSVQVGTHFRVGLDAAAEGLAFAPQPDRSLVANVTLHNLGNTWAGSLAVLAEGLPPRAGANATLTLPNGTALQLPLRDGFARFQAPQLLAPSEWAWLRIRVDAAAGVPAGHYAGRILVAGEAA